jgi:hypothetical protein
MKYLKTYEELIWPWGKKNKGIREIHKICKQYGIQNYTINSDGSIDVDGNVGLNFNAIPGMYSSSNLNKRLTKLPLKFRNVTGNFLCMNNYLTSLEGSPQLVGGSFNCHSNQLTSLIGSPQQVGVHFSCNCNFISSFVGSPKSIGGIFSCDDNFVDEIWNLFRDKYRIELFNDYDIIREDESEVERIYKKPPIIIMEYLNDFLQRIGKRRVPLGVQFPGYKIIEDENQYK